MFSRVFSATCVAGAVTVSCVVGNHLFPTFDTKGAPFSVAYAETPGFVQFNTLPNDLSKQTRWDYDWDGKHKDRNSSHQGSLNILLIRHGQYRYASRDSECTLTALGKQQAALTGIYLRQLNLPYSRLLYSTMTRAVETAEQIIEALPSNVKVEPSDLLREGDVYPPEPNFIDYNPKLSDIQEDNQRVEAAFRKYFTRRAAESGDGNRDIYEIMVCHGNVIRYLLCRALQLPPEAWSRFSLDHGSVTWIVVRPDGSVTCRMFGGSNHIPVDKNTFY